MTQPSGVPEFGRMALAGGGPFGTALLICDRCAALVLPDPEFVGRHLGWHEDRGETTTEEVTPS